jgi:predicted ATPase
MDQDRITQLRIAGMRTIKDLVLDLRGLTVLIGDNGTGKSSVLEAAELLRQAGKPVAFVPDILVGAHGGLRSILRHGSSELTLGARIEGGGTRLEYDFSIAHVGTSPEVVRERLDFYDTGATKPVHLLARTGKQALILNEDTGKPSTLGIGEQALAVAAFGLAAPPAFRRLTAALNGIETHVPFETRPVWQQKELETHIGPRWPSVVEATDRLARYATNLPNCYQQLRNLGDDVWSRVLDRAKLGLGDQFRTFLLAPSGRGNIELQLVFGNSPDNPLPVEVLSEGEIAYLAFIALAELNRGRTILAIDEPELHLHPALLTRVVWILDEVAERCPVVVATQSDRLLDALEDPAESAVLCALDTKRQLCLRRPSRDKLSSWLKQYRGLGTLRSEGYDSLVFDDEGQAPPGESDSR